MINMSWCTSVGCGSCSNACNENQDPSGIREALYAAEDAGVILVACAGNAGAESCPNSCSTKFPAIHSDVISVSGIADTNSVSYTDVGRDPQASWGWYESNVWGGGTNSNVPSVDLTGFFWVRKTFGGGVNTYQNFAVTGTSYAAPFIASLGVNFRQWLYDAGSVSFSRHAWGVMVNMLLMGDARSEVFGNPTWASFYVDPQFGYGFPRYFRPGYNMGTVFGWGAHAFYLQQDQTVSWTVGSSGPESTAISGWKWVVAADTGTTTPASYDVRVVDTCPTGGGEVVIATALNQARRYRIVLADAPNTIHGRCLEMRVTALSVPPGGQGFWTADYYWSNANSEHLRIP